MRIKIGDKWYDSSQQPICIEVSKTEQEQIGNMDREEGSLGRYASFPDSLKWKEAEMFNWLREG